MPSSWWEKWPDTEREKWRDYLRDMEFWLNQDRWPYLDLDVGARHVSWNVGVGLWLHSQKPYQSGLCKDYMMLMLGLSNT